MFGSQVIHIIPDPWPWIYNCLEQLSERVFRFNWVTLPLNWSDEKAWKNSVQHRWTHSSKENHGSLHASRYGKWKKKVVNNSKNANDRWIPNTVTFKIVMAYFRCWREILAACLNEANYIQLLWTLQSNSNHSAFDSTSLVTVPRVALSDRKACGNVTMAGGA